MPESPGPVHLGRRLELLGQTELEPERWLHLGTEQQECVGDVGKVFERGRAPRAGIHVFEHLGPTSAVQDPEGELGQLVSILRSAGADLFHVSTRRFWTPEWDGSDLGLAGWVKSFTDAPVIAVGSVGLDVDVMATLEGEEARPTGDSRIEDLIRRFRRGDFDLVSVGRSQIGDPDWVAKVRDDRIGDIRPFRRADIAFL